MSAKIKHKHIMALGIVSLVTACGITATPSLWRAESTASIDAGQPVFAASGDSLYQAFSSNGQATLRNVGKNGVQSWQLPLNSNARLHQIRGYGNGIIAVATNGWVSRINANGTTAWERAALPSEASVLDASPVTNNRIYISHVSATETGVIALDINGSEVWRYTMPRTATNDVAIEKVIALASGNVIALAHQQNQVQSIGIDSNGNQVGQTAINGSDIDVLSAYYANNTAYVIFDNALQRLNANGSVLWKQPIGVNHYCSEPADEEIACFSAAPEGVALTWYQGNGSIRINKTLAISNPRDMTYIGNQQWIVTSHAESVAGGSAQASAYWRLNVVDATGISKRAITLQPSTVSQLWPDYVYTSNGDGFPRVLGDAANVYASGATTLNRNAYLSAYGLK